MGRTKGVPNKVSGDAKKALAAFVNGNLAKVQSLWRGLADSENEATQARAIELYGKLADYVIPKARTEITGEDGGPVVVEIVKYNPQGAGDGG